MKSSSSHQHQNKLGGKSSLDDTLSTTAESSSSSWSSQEFSLERSSSFSSCATSTGGGNDDGNIVGGRDSKTVRFARQIITDVYAHPSRSEYTDEDRTKIWWSPAEMAKKHERAAASAAKILKSEAGSNNKKKSSSSCCSCLDEIVKNAMYIHTTTDNHEEFAILAQDEQWVAEHTKCLVAWTHREHNGRGLEPYLSKKFGEYQGGWMVASRSAVVEMSLMMRKPFSREVAENYQELSRTSVILARLMAEADAIAASRYQRSTTTATRQEEQSAPAEASSATSNNNRGAKKNNATVPTRPLFSKQSSGMMIGKFARSLVQRRNANTGCNRRTTTTASSSSSRQ